jgi:uncharacterized protein with HEPN domain
MRPDARAPLYDVLQACRLVVRFVEGRSLADCEADDLLRSAVERQLAIAGEALVRLHRIAPEAVEGITDWRRIIAFRNRLIHGYDVVTDAVVWGVVQGSVPVVVAEIEVALAGMDEEVSRE